MLLLDHIRLQSVSKKPLKKHHYFQDFLDAKKMQQIG